MAHLKRSTGTITKQTFNSPVLTTPALGTPASGVMTNMTGAVTASINDDQVGVTQMASGTDGNIISYDASGNPVAVATGSDGQILLSSGAGAVCAFEAAPSGGTADAPSGIDDSGNAVAFDINSSEQIRILNKCFINTTNVPNIPLGVLGDGGSRHFGLDTNTNTVFAFGGWQSSWCDRRIKKNIK